MGYRDLNGQCHLFLLMIVRLVPQAVDLHPFHYNDWEGVVYNKNIHPVWASSKVRFHWNKTKFWVQVLVQILKLSNSKQSALFFTDLDPSVCSQPGGKPGICKGAFQYFYYKEESGTCEPFIFGGCEAGSSENKFPNIVNQFSQSRQKLWPASWQDQFFIPPLNNGQF